MKDWKRIAQASGIQATDAELERSAAILAALEKEFRPLTANLPPESEPATEFNAGDENS